MGRDQLSLGRRVATIRSPGLQPVRLAAELDRLRPELVLVDCFGTLLHRSVPSGRVRELACAELAGALGLVDVAGLVAARRGLERALSAARSGPGHVRDHRSAELAAALHDHLGSPVADAVALPSPQDFVALFCAIEVAVEGAVCAANAPLAAVLGRLAVPVQVVSDTNLSASMLGDVLTACGLGVFRDGVVTSADAGETKRSGHLLPAVIAAAEVDAVAVVVVGDNPVSDGTMAERAGAESLLVRPGRWDDTKQASSRDLRGDLRRRLRDVLAPAGPDDVFPELALTLWLFATRLDAGVRRRGASRAAFLAREGLFLQRVHEAVQDGLAHAGRPPLETAYLLTSRKSTLVPSLVDPARQLPALVAAQPGITAADLVALLGLTPQVLPGSPTPDEPLRPAEVDALIGADDFRTALEERRARQTHLLRALVAAADPGEGELQVVDVGWKGTVRDHLALALDGRAVHAHLLGLLGTADLPHRAHKTGHLFANQPARTPYLQVFAHFKELYELLLAAGHGSVSAYDRDDTGEVVVVSDDDAQERRCHDELVAPFQQACLARVAVLADLLAPVRDRPPWVTDLVAAAHARMVYRPRRSELDAVEALVQYENFGARAVKAIGAGPTSSRSRLDPRRHVSGGGWPPLRMRRAGVGWQRVPYSAFKEAQLLRGALR